ncbi:TetR/AcrR family transcriptional regulator [Nocardia callitridis]|uniref:TetR/AcrR family transcriptional regulator n=1 Tax=Nocardia callitridis TaxID=648753 RepID=UPI0031EBC531
MNQPGTSRFAATYPPEQPGLPRGRSRLPVAVARERQHDRLLRAAISAIADKGYIDTNVADIVSRARVSRREFYTHFGNIEDCFLAAATASAATLFDTMSKATAELAPLAAMRAAIGAYLGMCAGEPEFTKCLIIDLPATGIRGATDRLRGDRKFATMLHTLHEAARSEHPGWPPAPDEAYLAAVGMIVEHVAEHLINGEVHRLPALTDRFHGLTLRLLGVPPH